MKRTVKNGFSLMELLVVMALITIILTFAIPATTSMMKSNSLTQGSQALVSSLALARQTAIAKNRNVEVRFLKFKDEEQGDTTEEFRGIQTVEIMSSSRAQPLGRLEKLPASVIINSTPELSSILDTGRRRERNGTESLGRLGTDYSYMAIRFRPDGSVDLAPDETPWFLTLHEQRGGEAPTATPPANFVTIEIDPFTGALKFYRPGV
jgi:uncharacterized protein (TIGR02596 family)